MGVALGGEESLSKVSDSEGVHQDFCSTSEEPEALSRDQDVQPSDDGSGRRTDQHVSVTERSSPSLLEEHAAEHMCTLVQSSCTLVDSSVRAPLLVSQRSWPTAVSGSLSPQGPHTIAKEEFPCDNSHCYGSHFHHSNLEDTFAAYCHPQPIPAPSQLLPPLTGSEALPHLSLPRLMSSLSESGLDAKPVSCCCQLGCSWVSMLPQHQGSALSEVGCRGNDMGSYGASVDPEELGLAIQKHLELQIKETASRAAKLSRQNTNTSRLSVSCQRKKRMLGSLRPPACCSRTSTAVD
ncbi:hypothetical protein WMY93_017905 [Mugilogobius chulae]|uniref:G protein-regulated inducer of neurite outgrowth C-terminal domain-containing protein n=1 Tax=Mugilogobius chulae TaxID=88201 RepID=A0AAW0NP75_9GOBI